MLKAGTPLLALRIPTYSLYPVGCPLRGNKLKLKAGRLLLALWVMTYSLQPVGCHEEATGGNGSY